MEISETAERILYGRTIEDKLAPLGRFEDRRPGPALVAPRSPGRPGELDLDRAVPGRRLRFTDVRRLHSEKERGLVLHFFCNHELLALELMALALLKFPDAPSGFRRGLARTLADEQEHVRLYLERMAAVGIGFGDIPVSDFFWRSIAPMASPLDFVTRLSLTLEQANLDYAVHYAGVYRRLGDDATAGILDRVYRDELSHVKHGLVWFERWREPGQDQWEAYRAQLDGAPGKSALTPGRAKGIGFNREGRRRIGLTERYIDELEVYVAPRRRCPALHFFNPAAEFGLAPGGRPPPASARDLARDLACLPMFYCRPGEALWVPCRPGTGFLRRLQDLGFSLPEFVESELPVALGDRGPDALLPWAKSPDSAAALAGLAPGETLWRDEWRALYGKRSGLRLLRRLLDESRPAERAWLCEEDCAGRYCASVGEAEAAAAALWEAGWVEAVAKGEYGAAGLGQVRLRRGRDPAAGRGALKRLVATHGGVVVEPWLDGVADFSAQVDLDGGEAEGLGWTRFFTDGRGRFRGAALTRPLAGLPGAARRFLYGDGRDPRRLERIFARAAAGVAAEAEAVGYRGPAGIDALLYHREGRLRFKPVIELNPRHTMGRVSLHLARRVNSSRTAYWFLLGPADLRATGCDTFAALQERLDRECPVETLEGQLSGGALLTNDPTQARSFAGLLLAAADLPGCVEALPGGLAASLGGLIQPG